MFFIQPAGNLKSSTIYSNAQSSVFKPQIKSGIKRSIQTITRTQTITIPKPIIKFTTSSNISPSETTGQSQQSPIQPQTTRVQQQWKPIIQQPVVQTVVELDEPPASLIKKSSISDDI